mgnify:CR=1 FL=1
MSRALCANLKQSLNMSSDADSQSKGLYVTQLSRNGCLDRLINWDLIWYIMRVSQRQF